MYTKQPASLKPLAVPPSSAVVTPHPISFLDAAETVLKACANQQPMHYKAITQEALKLKLLATQGQTPDATLYAQIITEINRQQRRGATPRFTKHGNGLFGLSKWLGAGLQSQIKQHNAAIASKLHARLLAMPPADFEALVVVLLVKLGFENVTATPLAKDGGIDVRGLLVIGDAIRINMAVQVKRWKANVQAPTVQQTRGALSNHEQGLVITTSSFSRGTVQAANNAGSVPIGLMDGKQLLALLMEHEMGVVRTQYDLFELSN